MRPYLLIFDAGQDSKMADCLEFVFKNIIKINPFTFIFPSLEELTKALEEAKKQHNFNNNGFIITQVSESVSLRNCDNIRCLLKEAKVQVFPSL